MFSPSRCALAGHVITFLLSAASLCAQTAPLEAVKAQGTVLPQSTVLEISGLQVGKAIDKPAIEEACKRLADSGLFASISYNYAPGPKRGYVVTLELSDQPATLQAVIDIPGVDEDATWQWMATRYPNFVRKVAESSQLYLAQQIQNHVASVLDGEKIAARSESDLATGRMLIIFQPETLPQISSLTFTGTQEFSSDDLAAKIHKAMGSEGFSPRRFKMFLDGTIRQAYEEHGMYRVQFKQINLQKNAGNTVAVSTDISEGPRFTLGQVQLIGDNLPRDAMLQAASFSSGGIANWTGIMQKIYRAEARLKRSGYLQAASHPERILHDDTHVLDIDVSYTMGPLFHFGQVTFSGLSPDLEAKAQRVWSMQTGAPFDMGYTGDFLREFSKSVDLRAFKISTKETGRSGYIVDETVIFAPK